MYLEKADTCPWCSKELTQTEYDLQRCDTCRTTVDFTPPTIIETKEEPTLRETPPIILDPFEQVRVQVAKGKTVHIFCGEPLTGDDLANLCSFLHVQRDVLQAEERRRKQ